ncbi:hypothetical protein QJS66_04665 [Kocuria rhizophila]|nr:hypothetical protein QJS66_04665 [Kocuria rhizophila]
MLARARPGRPPHLNPLVTRSPVTGLRDAAVRGGRGAAARLPGPRRGLARPPRSGSPAGDDRSRRPPMCGLLKARGTCLH